MTQNPTPRRDEPGKSTHKTEEEARRRSASDATGSTETGSEPERRAPEVDERREPVKKPGLHANEFDPDATV